MTQDKFIQDNFITKIIDDDNDSGKWGNRVHTRFPPEPNGYLHIGHAKSICLNFGLAKKYKGKCNLRFDDTNPLKEDSEYVNSIIEDVKWLGFQWEKEPLYASDYFEKMYNYALILIEQGNAFVCDLSFEEVKDQRGTLTKPGSESPFRERSIKENIELFQKMKEGEFKDGEKTLRAKIDMRHSNLNMRDPVMYRILHSSHHRTGNNWSIYPMYDWAHGLEDSIENITHSVCTLEFEDHRPLYDWYLDRLSVYHPRQIEFARLNLNFTIMSKRKLKRLVDEGHVDGWSDPRMPTVSGLRRRGYTPESIKNFSDEIGVTKRDAIVDVAKLENALRDDLNKKAPRVMGVLDPIKIIITNYPNDKVEYLDAKNNPEDESAGKRKIAFSKEIFIDRNDFMEDPPKKFFRLSVGKEVRLKFAYYITCNDLLKDSDGNIVELHCTYDPETKGGMSQDGRKVRGTLHWVSASKFIEADIRLYDRLFMDENPEVGGEFVKNLNAESLKTIKNAKLEMSLDSADSNCIYQFERTGYFILDSKDSKKENLIFNRAVSLRDSWARINR
ncbi:glutamine--tRNA ligase/YqeY domain fusion protein [bacterium]|jgi:glutaminyl-tRNA synthetase|nr:glutamine--tRNA ligase/YqeY domain fusion protein [bacterium]MBT4248809.1 glutamine--tRNA ligase/YqeY domain fusion protein [bacterium]MBT4926692.1 glutamine--tRNA ligase/YqeY domain fusion protein [bacterium]MBT5733214.1 glutamine--tRNA ligase/YqeY domain fusion protein [bacterium]MBT6019069.1 glutamine--tRNA ligase/YqeY domain fusion protein [bacterium]